VKSQIKNRIVTFRLSEDEYDILKSACGTDQHSVSSVARMTVLEWAKSIAVRPRVDERLTEVGQKLDALLQMFRRDHDGDLP
jgi:hypothetical protein